MEYTVVKDFIDRDTLKEFKAGSIFACLDDSRAKLLISRGYIEGTTAAPEEKEPEKKPQKKAKTAAKTSGSKSPAKAAAKKPASKKKV